MHDDGLDILGPSSANKLNLPFLLNELDQLVPFVGAGLTVSYGYPSWSSLLNKLACVAGISSEIDLLVSAGQYEEAAQELISRLGSQVFNDAIRDTFDDRRLAKPILSGPARFLPHIASGTVLTTNFDQVIECVFEEHGRPFRNILKGTEISEASSFIQGRDKCLLKLHGDCKYPSTRVLSLDEYAREYGGTDPNKVDLSLPLPRAVSHVLLSHRLLFLGCSLRGDRTTRVIAHIAANYPRTSHIALLPSSDDTPNRCKELASWNIRPLFFVDGEYWRVEKFLDWIARQRGTIPTAPYILRSATAPKVSIVSAALTPQQLLLRRLLRHKFVMDFKLSWLDSALSAKQALESSISDLIEADLIKQSNVRLGRGVAPIFLPAGMTSVDRASFYDVLRPCSPIRINCGALFPAALSVFLAMRDNFGQRGIDLRIDWSDLNSHNQLLRMEEKDGQCDFLMAADAAFFMFRDVEFRKLVTCHEENQWLVARAPYSADHETRIRVFPAATAEMQFKMKRGLPEKVDSTPIWLRFGEQIPYLRTRLELGESVLVWEPLAYIFLRDRRFVRVSKLPVPMWISLFCHKRWMHWANSAAYRAFLQLFIDQWCRSNENMWGALNRLLSEDDILDKFSFSAGLLMHPRYSALD